MGALGTVYQERDLAVAVLSFDYGAVRILAGDPRPGFFVAQGNALAQVLRAPREERQAQCVLESFGAVELACLQDIGEPPETEAQYLVNISDNVHSLCSFTAYAVPQLEALGWQVEIAPDYPYRVVPVSAPWFANIEADDERDDWFSLELGVEMDGRRFNLLPGLLELLNSGGDSDNLASLLRTPARFRALQVDVGQYVAIPPERLRRLLFVLEELYEGGTSTQFSKREAASVCALEDAFDDGEQQRLSWSGAREVVDLGRALQKARASSTSTGVAVPGLRATLRPYQQEGLDWLQNLRVSGAGGVLADDMGLGKTLQTISHLAKEKIEGRMQRPSLVVVPTSLIGNWQRELKKFAPFLRLCSIHGAQRSAAYDKLDRADVVITTYPILVRDLERFTSRPYYYLILDEAQAIKNGRSLAKSAVRSLNSEHRLCLTGTPVENNLGELWSLFDFLMPGYLGDAGAFRNRYQTPIERDKNEHRLLQLRSRVAPYILRRMKDTVAKDLPPKTEIVRAIDLDGDQRDLYESIRIAAHAEVRQVIRKKGLAASTVTILDALMKLRQVCCDPRLITSSVARHVKSSAKYEFLMDLLSAQLGQGRRILLFSQFTQMLDLIGQGLRETGTRFTILTGSTIDRQARCDEFERGDTQLFLISLKAGGTGLNLTSADTVVHYDPWWNPAAQAQATDRAYRIGQTRPVFVYNLIVAGSVEERMLRLQKQKRHLADTLLSGHSSEGGLTEYEVDDLFQPLSDAPPSQL
jgi:superfamily II DNA or RNA helicase